MHVKAKSRYVRVSPYKLRLFADAIRGQAVGVSLDFLKARALQRLVPMIKLLASAYANARQMDSKISSMNELFVKEIRVDQGPTVKYYKPGAMGRAGVQRKRLCHMEVVLDKVKVN